uniref:SNF2 histone linker PHD RING helicase n=1 Tax=Sinocyclocheilus rhinocerous TaxID=307959 RepID=A0A673KBQ7_9TELE
MSSRRKRAPPVRMDEETKRRLEWNMHEDWRNEGDCEDILESIPAPSDSCHLGQVLESNQEESNQGFTSSAGTEEGPSEERPSCSTQDSLPDTIELNVMPISALDQGWNALIGDFNLCPKIPFMLGDNSFCLQQTGDTLIMSLNSEELEVETGRSDPVCPVPVECSFGGILLEDLDWLQKRKVIKLCQASGDESVKLKIFLLESGLGRPEFLNEGNGRIKKAKQLIQKLMEFFYDFIIPEVMENEEEECDTDLERQNVEELYDHIRHLHQTEAAEQSFDVQHPGLIPVLRPYQSQAVNWMLRREKYKSSSSVPETTLSFFACTFGRCYANLPRSLIREFPLAGVDWPGGILADEMGLGKTVEVLALILCNTRQNLEHGVLTLPGRSVNYFVRPKEKIIYPAVREMLLTAIKEMRVGKGASVNKYDTLKNRNHIEKILTKHISENIVEQIKGRGLAGSFKQGKNYKEKKKQPATPRIECAGLDRQPKINVHTRIYRVYQGVKRHGFIQPHILAEQDVVITTYDVLRTELDYVDIPHSSSKDGRRFRNQKRYMAIPSPLVAMEWWSVCLDEAQMVECITAKAAEMALRLTSVNRRCVSGTPVQRGLEDLYGLVLFLGVDPYWVKYWWDQLLYCPYRHGNTAPLYNVIGQLLWRSIQILPQTEEIHWLNFSPVEGHFYHRQHEVCSQDALVKLRKISDWSLKLGSLDRHTVTTILYPLLRLRQRLHATHNLMELLNAKHPGIPPTLRDDSLKEEAEQLKQHYMAKVNSEVSEAHQNLQPVLQHIKELKRKVNLHSLWWLDVLQQAIQYSMDDDLVGHIQNELTCSYKQQANKLSLADKFRDARGLQFLLSTQMDDLMKSQKTVQDAVKKLEGPPSQQVIEEATFCHLRPSQDKSTGGLNPEPCPICARPLIQEWAVLTCGHCFCNECIAINVEQYSVGNRRRAIKCAICQRQFLVEAVVRVLKKIQMTDPGAKSLVFSTWQGVLDIIAKALFNNNMEFAQINGIHKFQENLSAFKYEEKILLLPLHTGSNGLNIIEATHVQLVEPILNPAHELQAIGRVHRIGQTKPTFVHRFLIKSTIEERMQAMLKTAEKSHSSTSMKHSEASVITVADLSELFTEDSESLE